MKAIPEYQSHTTKNDSDFKVLEKDFVDPVERVCVQLE